MSYKDKLHELRNAIKALKLDKRKLEENQLSMLNFIEGKKDTARFVRDNSQAILAIGNERRGFAHILLRHYGEDCEGKLSAREILNISFVLSGRKLTDYELNDRDAVIGYELTKQNVRFRVLLNRDGEIFKILTYFSDR